jgi:hypothetical protein
MLTPFQELDPRRIWKKFVNFCTEKLLGGLKLKGSRKTKYVVVGRGVMKVTVIAVIGF